MIVLSVAYAVESSGTEDFELANDRFSAKGLGRCLTWFQPRRSGADRNPRPYVVNLELYPNGGNAAEPDRFERFDEATRIQNKGSATTQVDASDPWRQRRIATTTAVTDWLEIPRCQSARRFITGAQWRFVVRPLHLGPLQVGSAVAAVQRDQTEFQQTTGNALSATGFTPCPPGPASRRCGEG